ncbi:MAG: repair protein RecO protein [Candidatus Magasanikbacteria bacterium GW2011_GWA2_46_17]|uniref:DNA repair protein RecO n=1 Tax=Candidatus Magasanikbacteria bacterium GW2011_GWA2_46_17 TaxID=1619042 RepID=A0A0G1S297_9BACT|nr:MAG: repair protein RecO protein [Candidatus Magasanikbacteria bacterium GW2011_GWA2_46_17]
MISFYTRECGKLELLARGIKKIESKNSPHVEPFSYADIEFAAGKELYHLTKVQPIQSFKNIRSDLHKSLVAEYASKLLDVIVEPRAKDERIFDLFLGWLQFLENVKLPDSGILLLAGFVFKLFSYLGFQPVLDKCVVGDEEIVDAQEAQGFYFAGGGVVCPAHKTEKQRVGEFVIDISFEQVSVFRLLLVANWQAIAEISMESKEASRLWNIVYQFAQFHSEKKLPVWLSEWA